MHHLENIMQQDPEAKARLKTTKMATKSWRTSVTILATLTALTALIGSHENLAAQASQNNTPTGPKKSVTTQQQSESATEISNEPSNDASNDTGNIPSKGTPVVFDTTQSIEGMEPGAIVSKTFYYSNANDDPAATPTVGEENGVKYIKISALGGNPGKMADTEAKLNRWVKIPENAPSTIHVSFKTKITKNEDFDWLTAKGAREPQRRNKIIINFMRDDGISGGNVKIDSKNLSTLDNWVEHKYAVKIPEKAQYLHLGLETSGAYSLWLGDWTIE